ncbi:MAG TPA: nitroreductase family protein [Ilumatobacter sp.]|nr:nitroreductase family protein [Ilumatobacter sp.]
MDLYEAMATQRAVRRLQPDPIPDDVLGRVLQAATWAPTGANTQPWRIVAVRDQQLKQGLADVYRPEWERFAGVYTTQIDAAPPELRPQLERNRAAGDHLAATLQSAPVLLVFCFDPRQMAVTDRKLDRVSVVGGASVYPAVQNVLLACVAEGLGCVLTTLHCLREPEVKELLDIPAEWGTAALVPIGYPERTGHGPTTRRPVTDLVSTDRFGTQGG